MVQQNNLYRKFKKQENDMRQILPKNSIVGIRLDGKAFNKFTKQYAEPYDLRFMNSMDQTARYIMDQVITGAMFAYVQSDEITIFFTDLWNENSQFPFSGKIEKILSVSASAATGGFMLSDSNLQSVPLFDARMFILQKNEIIEYLDWRRMDAQKNAITMAASCLKTHKELMNVSTTERLKLLEGTEFEKLPDGFFNGRLIYREERVENVVYVNKRDNTENAITVTRKPLVTKPALRDTTSVIVDEMDKIFS